MHQKVFIIGFMGAGKTTVAKKISESTGIPFFDTDAMIEEITGMSVSSIFLTWGEKYFRRMERDVIHQLMADRSSFVAALGGGSI
jgi:shikimate kinase